MDKNSELTRVTRFLKKKLLLFKPPFLSSQTNSQQRTKSQPERENPPGASMKLKGGTEEFHLSEGDPSPCVSVEEERG